MHFTVDRSKWLHGEGAAFSQLLRPSDEKMCCLGFRAIQSGSNQSDILGLGTPRSCLLRNIPIDWGLLLSPNDGYHTTVASKIMASNDEQDIPDSEREANLTALFAEIGDTIEFTGEYNAG